MSRPILAGQDKVLYLGPLSRRGEELEEEKAVVIPLERFGEAVQRFGSVAGGERVAHEMTHWRRWCWGPCGA